MSRVSRVSRVLSSDKSVTTRPTDWELPDGTESMLTDFLMLRDSRDLLLSDFLTLLTIGLLVIFTFTFFWTEGLWRPGKANLIRPIIKARLTADLRESFSRVKREDSGGRLAEVCEVKKDY